MTDVEWEFNFLLQITDLYISDQRLCDCGQYFEKVHSGFLSQSFKGNVSQSEDTSNQIWIFCSPFYLSICLFQRIWLPKKTIFRSLDIAQPILEHPSVNAIQMSSYDSYLDQQISLNSYLGFAPLLIAKYLIRETLKFLNEFLHLFGPSTIQREPVVLLSLMIL